jgi:hypothetical protein
MERQNSEKKPFLKKKMFKGEAKVQSFHKNSRIEKNEEQYDIKSNDSKEIAKLAEHLSPMRVIKNNPASLRYQQHDIHSVF